MELKEQIVVLTTALFELLKQSSLTDENSKRSVEKGDFFNGWQAIEVDDDYITQHSSKDWILVNRDDYRKWVVDNANKPK